MERTRSVPSTRKRAVLRGMSTWSSGFWNGEACPLEVSTPMTVNCSPRMRITSPTSPSAEASPRFCTTAGPSTASRCFPASSCEVNMRPAARAYLRTSW